MVLPENPGHSPVPHSVPSALATAVAGTTKPLATPDEPVDSSPLVGVISSGSSIGQVVSATTSKLPLSLPGKPELILSQKGLAYVVFQGGGNPRALRVGSKQLNNLIREHAQSEGRHLRKLDITEINDSLIAKAEMAGVIKSVHYRIAPLVDGIEIDLGDDKGSRVVVKAGKVEIITQGSKNLFFRTPVSAPMVMPAEVGNYELLKKYLNISDIDRLLFIAWLSYTLAHPKISTSNFIILVINGDQGSGKTTICNNLIYPLIDPNLVGVQVFPGNAKDLAIALQNSHVLCFDNMRNFKADMSDILCMAATGGAISNRALYSDADQNVLHLHGALVLNGIHGFINQADLAQRCLPIRTLTLKECNRKSETAMVKGLEADLPVILRGLLDLIAKVFLHLPNVEVTNPERMLDFVHWLAGMEKAQGVPAGVYQQAYSDSLRQAQLDSLMENMLASAVVKFCDDIKVSEWSGTPADLLEKLNAKASTGTDYSRDWPQNAISLSKRLNGLKASLLSQGIDIQFGRGKERIITIRMEGGSND
jgi:hypothetical protein